MAQQKADGVWKTLLKTVLFTAVSKPLIEKLAQTAVDLMERMKKEAGAYLQFIVELLIVVILALTGMVFILIGLAQYLESISQLPGAGLLYVGCATLIITMVLYLIIKQKYSRNK